jgi:PilZ domain-containing protein
MPSPRDQSPSPHDARALMRRLDERLPTRATALAYCHGRFQTVRVVDYSPSGLQLQGCFGVAAGDELIVELLSGDRVAAKVAWSLGSRLGVRFLQALEGDHPALLALQQAARRTPGSSVDA